MRLPRDVRGTDLERALGRLGYRATRHRGSYVRMTTQVNGEHHEVIPRRNPVKAKTLSSILSIERRRAEFTAAILYPPVVSLMGVTRTG